MTDSTIINSSQLKNLLIAGSEWLKIHVPQINAANVFPVPDGDTGSNMLLTLQAALKETQSYSGFHAGDLAAIVSHGALMGARGNSGVILSQILEGFSEAIDGKETFSLIEFARALQFASNKAYGAVINPVEGTILTVIKETAKMGQRIAGRSAKLSDFLGQLVAVAKSVLQSTPALLPVLKEAGVVDSGGQGLVYILEGMFRYASGLPVDVAPGEADDAESAQIQIPMSLATPEHPYDVQFLIEGNRLNIEAIRRAIAGMGSCPLVVGTPQTVKVHIHVADPGQPLSYGITQGKLLDVVVENMAAQYRQFSAKNETAEQQASLSTVIICVVPGPGLAKVCNSLGDNVIISNITEWRLNNLATSHTGTGGNPSATTSALLNTRLRTGSGFSPVPATTNWASYLVLISTQNALPAGVFLQVIDTLPAQNIVILPNHKKSILAAQQAAEQTSKNVAVIPSQTIPQGISALLVFDPEAGLDKNQISMKNALSHIETIEVSRAAHNSTAQGHKIQRGNFVGTLNGKPVSSGKNINQVTLDTLGRLEAALLETLTIYYGKNAPVDTANSLPALIAKTYPHFDIQVINGGQSNYHYIISVE